MREAEKYMQKARVVFTPQIRQNIEQKKRGSRIGEPLDQINLSDDDDTGNADSDGPSTSTNNNNNGSDSSENEQYHVGVSVATRDAASTSKASNSHTGTDNDGSPLVLVCFSTLKCLITTFKSVTIFISAT